MAATSIDLSFRSTGRWATWVMAPPPMMPTRSRSDAVRLTVMRPPSVQALELRAGVVRRDDLAVVLACARAPYRPPLAEPDTVPRAATVGDQACDPSPRSGGRGGEGAARERLPRRGTQHLPHGGTAHPGIGPAERDHQLSHPARGGAPRDPDVPHLADLGRLHACRGGQGAPEGSLKTIAAPLLPPAEARGDAAIGAAVGPNVGGRAKVRPVGRRKSSGPAGVVPPQVE